MFYDYLNLLCAERGITITELMKGIGLSPSAASRWKSKGYYPENPTLKKIADYFEISVKELLSDSEKEQNEKPLINNDKELTELLEEVGKREELRMLFRVTKKARKEDVLQAIRIIEAIRGKE